MKLIIEKMNGSVYAYRENKRQFKVNQPQRDTPPLEPKELDHDCVLDNYGDFHMVFDIKK